MSYSNFLPNFHYRPASEKLTEKWFHEARIMCWNYGNCKGLLDGKDINEIEGYAIGNYSMNPYKKMFKSEKAKLDAQNLNNPNYINVADIPIDIYVQTPLINSKLNSAQAIVDKIVLEIGVTAKDPLAIKKKKEDFSFLKNKSKLEADLQPLSDEMGLGKVDFGTTKYSAIPFSDNPYGLDLNNPEEESLFSELYYNLAVEAALESVLQQWSAIKNVEQIRSLETRDQFWYGVSTHFSFESAITGLPDVEYCFPGNVRVPFSHLRDYNDTPYRFFEKKATILELLNYSSKICKDDLYDIMNAPITGYCACNKMNNIKADDFGWRKVDLVLCMIKSVDFVGIAPLNKKSKFTYVVTDPEEAEKCTNKVWGQNLYYGWWLKNTDYYFGIDKLSYAHREVGQESIQGFPINILESQKKSAVELSIGENKKAQVADIKMQHAILMSLPAGRYIDVRFIRNYLSGTKEGLTEEGMLRVLTLALEKNIILGDTEGFEGKNDGQFKAVIDLPGGVKTELLGYMQVIADANMKISQYTGINENLIGQKAEELVRNNNAIINAGINALDYVSKAIQEQYKKLFNSWANLFKDSIEKGGKAKEAIVNLIGNKQVNLIDALDELPLHTMGITVSLNQNERWKAMFNQELNKNSINGVLDSADIYILEGITNTKQKFGFLATKINQWKEQKQKEREEDFANQQAMIASQGENLANAVREKTSGKIQEIYAEGDRDVRIIQLANELGGQGKQLDFLFKKHLQQDRGNSQLNKSIVTLKEKANLEQQKAVGT